MMNRSRARRRYHRRNKVTLRRAWILSVLAAAVIIYGAVELVKGKDREVQGDQVSLAADVTRTVAESTRARSMGEVWVGSVVLTGLTREEAEQKLGEAYLWDMKVTDTEESVPLDDLVSPQLKLILEQIQQEDMEKPRKYDLDYGQLEQAFTEQAAGLAQKWDRGAVDSQMDYFDSESGTYHYTKETSGRTLKQEQLVSDLVDAVKTGNLTAEIQAEFDTIAPKRTSAQAKEQYKIIGTFTTTTTDNKNRNQNIRLASDAIDGVVLKPGEEFSFNLTTGNRTSEKGYQPAGAYRNGVLIEEPGGGVCQVSTTLYHAIVNSGYKTSERNFHSFAPSYIEKGQDAMVSFDGYAGPDLRFVNTQNTSVGLRAAFDGKQLKLSIVGLPVLESNERVSMRSEKVKDLEPPAPEYEENPELAYGEEKTVEQAKPGSVWKTYRILSRDGQTVEETFLHTSTYKSKPAKIQKNSAALPASGENIQQGTGADTAGGQETNETGGQGTENPPAEEMPPQETPAAQEPVVIEPISIQ